MNQETVYQRVVRIIQQVAANYAKESSDIQSDSSIVEDLGFSSLEVAVLTSKLEIEFDCEPFTQGLVPVTDIQTVQHVCTVYQNMMNGKPADAGLNTGARELRHVKRVKRR